MWEDHLSSMAADLRPRAPILGVSDQLPSSETQFDEPSKSCYDVISLGVLSGLGYRHSTERGGPAQVLGSLLPEIKIPLVVFSFRG
jgi:hypothetical protein